MTPPRSLPAAEESLQRTVTDYLALCVSAPPDGPWWITVNPIPAKSRAAALLATLGVPSRVGAVMPASLTQAER